MDAITIDYNTLALIVVALFAISGYLRGWWREAITTVFLVLLSIFLTQPELARSIIEAINNFITVVWTALSGLLGATLPSTVSIASTTTPPIVLNPENQSLYVVILVVIVLLSYFTSKITLGGRTISFGGRIFGGILGAVNGFIAVNLFKEFVVGRLVPGTGVSIQSAAPSTIAVSVSNVPPDSVFTGTPLLVVILLGVFAFALLLANRMTRKGRRVPWGYGQPLIPKPAEKKAG
jgi:hypothetical protein